MNKKNQSKIQAGKNQRFLMLKSLRAQLKIQEMAFMLVAIILFFILVGLFAVSIVYKNFHEQATQIEEERALSAIENLAGTPEFMCSLSKSNCVDADKLLALLGKKSYDNFWPFSSLSVLKSSGFSKDEQDWVKCNLQNYPDCDVFEIYDENVGERAISSFVALCRIEYENNGHYNKCEIAKLIAGSRKK